MKLKAVLTINLGLFMDLRPEIELDVPDGLAGQELIKYLHQTYWGLLTPERIDKEWSDRLDKLKENARHGIASDIREYQAVIEHFPNAGEIINESKKEYNREKYKELHPKVVKN